ncbi:hypothetical protein DFJ74DRAFT_100442 [Hyaloraphidium curvatum]|nr:hypothetical protein DFJ74DRAFT_100442 [Hyaloraphidium curvatum]
MHTRRLGTPVQRSLDDCFVALARVAVPGPIVQVEPRLVQRGPVGRLASENLLVESNVPLQLRRSLGADVSDLLPHDALPPQHRRDVLLTDGHTEPGSKSFASRAWVTVTRSRASLANHAARSGVTLELAGARRGSFSCGTAAASACQRKRVLRLMPKKLHMFGTGISSPFFMPSEHSYTLRNCYCAPCAAILCGLAAMFIIEPANKRRSLTDSTSIKQMQWRPRGAWHANL